MASIIRIKRSSTNGNPSTLGAGELAYSALSGTVGNGGDRLYIGMGSETSGNAANHVVIGGKYFTDMMDHTPGTLTASSALLVDADSKLDNLKVDNLDFNGNTISSTDANGNIIIDPAGTGYVAVIGTNGIVIPVGTNAQRGPSVQGTIRYNSDNSQFEGFSGTNWGSLGGVRSVDGGTYISPELTPGASDDTLRFVTNGTLAASLDDSSLSIESKISTVTINATTESSSVSTGALVVDGGVGIAKDLYVGGDLNVAGSVAYDGGAVFNGGVTLVGSDTAATESFKIQNGSAVDKFTVDSANGNTAVAGTLDVNGQATLASLNVEDLTSTRLVYVGSNGELVDSSNLTFSGSQLGLTGTLSVSSNATVGGTLGVTGAVTMSSTLGVTSNATVGGTLGVTGAVSLASTLDVNGQATVASLNVEDLTATRIVYVGASGELVDNSNLTFSGTQLGVTGTLAVSSNATVGGTLGVTGAATLSSTLDVTSNTTVGGTLGVTGAATLSSTLQVNGATTIGQSGTRVATTVYGTAVSITGTDNSTIGINAGSAAAKTLTIVASNSVGDASLDINVDDTATLDATSISLDSTDSSNFSMTANSASTKTLSIDAVNGGTGSAVIEIGSADTDEVKINNNTTTGKFTVTTAELEANVTTLDVNADVATLDATTSVTVTTAATTINSDTVLIRGTEGAADTSNVTIAGRLDVDNIRMDGNTISTTDGSNTIYIDPAPAGSAGLVVIEGNLQVNGTQTTVNSTTVTIDDPIFTLGGDTDPSADDNLDRGIEFRWHDGVDAKLGFFGWDDSLNEFTFVPDATDTAGVITGTYGNFAFGKGRLTDTTVSNSTSTGALTVAGGVGIGGQLNVAGATNKFTATTTSTSTTTGAVVVAGGVGVGGTVYIGTNLIGAGADTSTLSGFDIDGGTY